MKERNKERACARERDRSRERENRERQRETESEPDVRMARKWEERARSQSTWLFYGALCSQKATSFSEMIYRSRYTRTHAEKGTDVETEITPKGILLCADGISRELRSTAHLLRDGVRCAPYDTFLRSCTLLHKSRNIYKKNTLYIVTTSEVILRGTRS